MATQAQIESLYDWVHPFHIARSGDYADFSCAYFNGDFNQSLVAAQRAKHEWVLEELRFCPGDSILDVGCGWGAMLNAVSCRGGHAVGLTLSRAQAKYCAGKGLDAKVQDWKTAPQYKIGVYDGIVAIGSFEHFCSIEEYASGKQDSIYRSFFQFCADALPVGGRLFLQTMTWGKKVPDPKQFSLHAAEGTPERILARLSKFYPGSWVPNGKEQIIANASGLFDFLYSSNGRLDYIETLNRWGQEKSGLWKSSNMGKIFGSSARLALRYCFDSDFRIQLESLKHNDQQVCFLREIMSHERMFFARK